MRSKKIKLLFGLLLLCTVFYACFKDDLQREIDDLRTTVNLLQKRSDSLNSVLNVRADSLVKALSAAKKRSDSLSSVLTLKSDSLSQALGLTNSNLSALAKSVDSIKVQIVAINGQLSQLNTQLISITGELTKLNQQMASLSGSISSLSAQYQTLSNSLQSINNQIVALQNEQSKLQERLNAILLILNTPVDITSGLVAYFPFSGNALDSSGNANHATSIVGAKLTSDRNGKLQSAYYFDGYSWLAGNASNFPAANSPRTIAFWYNAENLNQALRKGFFGYGGGGCGNSFIIQFDNYPYPIGNYEIQGHCTAFFNYTPYAFPANNAWHHVAIIYDGDIIRFYNDGTLSYTSARGISTNTNSSGRIFAIGREVSSDGLSVTVGAGYVGIQGKLDEVRVYQRALTPDQIKYLTLN